MDDNPFLAPDIDEEHDLRHSGGVAEGVVLRIQGKDIVVRHGADLRGNCAVCGTIAGLRDKKKTLYFASPWIFLLILVNLLVLLIVYLVVRQKVSIQFSLCDRHQEHWRTRSAIAWVGWLAIVGAITAGIALGEPAWLGYGALGALIWLIVSLVLGRTLSVRGNAGGRYRIRGFGRGFRDAIADRVGRPRRRRRPQQAEALG